MAWPSRLVVGTARFVDLAPILDLVSARRGRVQVAFSSAASRNLVWSKLLLHGDSCKSERKEGSIRLTPRWSKQPSGRRRGQDVRIVVADAVHAGTEGALLEGAVMGLPRQCEQRRQRSPRVEPVTEQAGFDDRWLAMVDILEVWRGHRSNDGEGLQWLAAGNPSGRRATRRVLIPIVAGRSCGGGVARTPYNSPI